MTDFIPTVEQTAALALFGFGDSLAIEAGAGTGKTSTLQLIGNSTPRRGQYLAFNKAIVNEAKTKMPGNVSCSTAHGLAFRTTGRQFAHRLDGGRMKSMQLARHLGIDPQMVHYGTQAKTMASGFLASHLMKAIEIFCQSADPVPTRRHVPYIDGIDLPTGQGDRTYTQNDVIAAYLESFMVEAWADLTDPDGRLPYKHSHYLKAWQLSKPTIAADFILFDEAQDASPVMLDVIAGQTHAQLVFVGDTCQPPGTMVTRVEGRGTDGCWYRNVPIETLAVCDRVLSYDVGGASFHRAGREIDGISARSFDGDLVTVKAGPLMSRYTPDHHCIARFGGALEGRSVVYMMRRGTSFRVGRAAGIYGDRAPGAMARAKVEGADSMWILSVHDTPEEAALAEAVASARWGIPMMLFRAAPNRLMSQPMIDAFWPAVGDLTDQASLTLRAHGRDLRWPLWSEGDRLHVRRPGVIRACNLIDGMHALNADREWVPIETGREPYKGLVYSMTVEGLHTYVADGMVTHNCQQIYAFTGAVNALANVPTSQRTFLTQSFRFGPDVAAVANDVLAMLDADLRLVGSPNKASVVGPIADPDVVLTRTNAGAMQIVLDALKANRRVRLVGGGAEVVSFAEAAQSLMAGNPTFHHELACFDTWGEVTEYVANDPQGSELKLLVSLVEDYSPQALIEALKRMIPEARADVVVSTAHKSKGREWSGVQLGGDFPDPRKTAEGVLSDDELRLIYVACTRAQHELDIEACALFSAPSTIAADSLAEARDEAR